jgi:RNA polymerase sigma-70 factor (ECF subfamily)
MVANDFKTKVLPVSKKMLRYACSMLHSDDEGHDIVQDVFLKLWQKRAELDNIDNIEAYAMRMTHNRCLDVIKSNRRVSMENENKINFKQADPDVSLKIELSESAEIVRKLIKRLPEGQRTVMELRDIDQMSYEEIIKITNLNINTIRVNLSRARKKVRDEFLKFNSDGKERGKTIATALF